MIDIAHVTARTMRLIRLRSSDRPARSTIELCLIEAFTDAAGGWDKMHANSCENRNRPSGPCLPCCLMSVVWALRPLISRENPEALGPEELAERIHAGLMAAIHKSTAMNLANRGGN